MQRDAVTDLRAAIEANTERRSLEELAAQGKKHVRVVSGDKVVKLIQAIVDDAIQREAAALSKKDRDRIVSETKQQFDRVVKIQADQDAVIQEQKRLLDQHKQRADEAVKAREEFSRALEQERTEKGRREERLAVLEKARAEAEQALHEASERERKAERVLGKLETRQENLKTTLQSYEGEIDRLTEQLRDAAALIEELRSRLEAREQEIAAAKDASTSQSVSDLRAELAEMKAVLLEQAKKPAGADEETVAALFAKLTERDSASTAQLEERFSAQMDKTLDEIGKTLRAATAKPLDDVVEATDVLVSRIFDHGDEMKTNLGSLDVEERTSKTKIASNLERLKAMRMGSKKAEPESEGGEDASDSGDASNSAGSGE